MMINCPICFDNVIPILQKVTNNIGPEPYNTYLYYTCTPHAFIKTKENLTVISIELDFHKFIIKDTNIIFNKQIFNHELWRNGNDTYFYDIYDLSQIISKANDFIKYKAFL